MGDFDSTAWRQLAALHEERYLSAAERVTPVEALTEIFEGWDRVAHIDGTPPGTLREPLTGTEPKGTLVAFTRSGISAAVLIRPYTCHLLPGTVDTEWRAWADTAPVDRAERLLTALRWGTLVGPTLIAVVEQMTAMARTTAEEQWAGLPERVLPFALAQMAPEERAAYKVLAGLGAYAT